MLNKQDKKKYYLKNSLNRNFSVEICLSKIWDMGTNFKEHWHEELQFFYFIKGNGYCKINKTSFTVSKNDIVVINSNQLHYMKSLSNDLQFYLIRINLPFLFSNDIDLCQTKYMSPLSQNLILFKNLIRNDKEFLNCIENMINEYLEQKIGYELSVKSYLYNCIVLLLRNYVDKYITPKQLNYRINNYERFYNVFNYISENYADKITTEDLAEKAHLSTYYFSRIFKEITERTPTEYINDIRLKKSLNLLKSGNMNITEISITCGFNDVNYYSRLFKNKYGVSPTKFKY